MKSSLQRARARLAEVDFGPDDVVEPSSPPARRLLDAYLTAFETADVDALLTVLRVDVTLELLPNRQWFAGVAGCSRVSPWRRGALATGGWTA